MKVNEGIGHRRYGGLQNDIFETIIGAFGDFVNKFRGS
jgi:hypothetical protein